jgi:hypothetical protein
MKRPLLLVLLLTLLAPAGVRAEFRQIDLTIFGMD